MSVALPSLKDLSAYVPKEMGVLFLPPYPPQSPPAPSPPPSLPPLPPLPAPPPTHPRSSLGSLTGERRLSRLAMVPGGGAW